MSKPREIRRLLYICGDHGAPAFGRKGASTHIREMIRAFRALGVEVLLAAADVTGDRREDEDFHTIALPRPTSRLLGFDGRYLLADHLANAHLRSALARFRPDAIYERSALYFLAGDRLARSARLPRILEANTILSEELRTRLRFPGWAARRERALLAGAPRIAAISDTLVAGLEARWGVAPGAARPFTMAVNPQVFRRAGLRDERRRAAGLPGDLPVLGSIGSMNHYHKPEWFFEVVAQLAAEGLRFGALVVGGKGRKIELFREQARERCPGLPVHFTGPVAQEEMPGWIEAMDLVVIPGAAPQSTPTKLFEAAALGVPIVAPDEAPIQKLMGQPAPGLLFPRESREALASLVRDWLRDPARLQPQADAFRDFILAERTWERQARRALDWLAEPAGS